MTRRIDKSTSGVLDRQIPEFVRENFELFVQFVKQYYDWLDQRGNVDDRIKRLIDQKQFKYSDSPYIDHLLDDFLVNLPKNLNIDYDLLLRNIKIFYSSKGTESAIKYFFNIFRSLNTSFGFYITYSGSASELIGKTFTGTASGSIFKITTATTADTTNTFVNVELLNGVFPERGDVVKNINDYNEYYYTNITNFNVDVSYPKTRILRSSNGVWKNSSIIVIKSDYEINVIGKSFVSSINENLGFIDSQNLIKLSGQYYYELKISFNLFKSWSVNENIIIDDKEYTCSISCADINIISSGSNYVIGDEFNIKNAAGSFVGKVRVKSTTKSKVTEFKINYGGYNYSIGDEIIIGDGLGIAVVSELGSANSIVAAKIIYSSPWISEFQSCTISSQLGYDADITFYSNNIGKIKQIEIIDSGVDITEDCFIDIPGRTNEEMRADIEMILSTLKYTSYSFISDSGLLDESDKIQDNFYYQDYSYVVRSGTKIDYDNLIPIYKKIVHPAGTKVFFTSINNTESTTLPSKAVMAVKESLKKLVLFSYGYKRIFDAVDYDTSFKNSSVLVLNTDSAYIATTPKIITTNQYLYLSGDDTINTLINTVPTMHKYSMQPGHKETIISII